MTQPTASKMSALDIATSRPVARRALGYGVVVGTILITINHGDAILRGDVDSFRIFKMGLTTLVPYMVSTLSSVQATQDNRRANQT
ncbi:MAG: nitrate/nitrite transporter NrtS [Myxococcota bacterium]|jgi:hypothetical protein